MADVPLHEMLARTPPTRDVVSFSVGVDNHGKAVLFKFLLANKTTKVIITGPAIAFNIRDSIKHSSVLHNYQNILNSPTNARLQQNKIDKFARKRPAIEHQDWDAMAGGESHIPVHCDVSSFSDVLFLSFRMPANRYEIFRMNPGFVGHLAGVIDMMERDGKIVNPSSVPTPS